MKNNRTFLEKLLDGSEVEWKPLDEVANIVNNARKPVKSSLRVSGNIPYYGANNIQDYVEGYTHEGEFVLIAEDGSASLENYSIQWAVGKFWANNHVHVVNGKEKLNNRFLYHYLTNMNFIPFLAGKERAKLTKAKLQQIPIPIPPLSVQTEIVKILDALTALTSELTSELILRQKQYEYYREKLLSEEELGKVGFEWKPLGEVTNIKTGQAVSKYSISQNPGIYPVINSGREPLGFINEWNTENDPIGITTRGAGVGSITWQEGKYFRGNLNYSVTVKSDYKLNIRFLYHILLHFQKEIHNLCSFTGIPALNASELKKLEISIPAIEEQQRIVSILDKFETLTNSITEGLPLAIEQSQKRYEYYRELLLNFPGRE
ncbi:TPA: restriction endonuclease subunit S [Haemophilus influenzae]|uniref:restriction endonuclease subunit S n=1 Tax=Haemophilus influenzae TaxID=727 RepID=UPI0006697498|nr:restriction endonuclease subunit S [Haemophilus influenzae]MCK8791402.1 restriction endonuclease subunit S [Haemophilus influenzae]MCK9025090.1 restriction endonuclease subunit S [Haemophilus influenzae]OLV20535.1 restriction endonuclease subunit S [Haemophilus influenzae]OLV21126.1 restriction endonuclease subunit S [Haemophilus influenzae]PRK48041.1 putative type-1 restriction enzyme specificity protein [Haemophilus influenzae]